MKKTLTLLATVLCLALLAAALTGCLSVANRDGSDKPADNSNAAVEKKEETDGTLGDYVVEIKSARLAKDYEDKDIVIVTYGFTNNGKNANSFMVAISDKAYQNGIECDHCYFVKDSENYNSDNQSKDIKTGATLEVEVAYNLNDTTTPLELEVAETFSFSDKKLTKTFDLK